MAVKTPEVCAKTTKTGLYFICNEQTTGLADDIYRLFQISGRNSG